MTWLGAWRWKGGTLHWAFTNDDHSAWISTACGDRMRAQARVGGPPSEVPDATCVICWRRYSQHVHGDERPVPVLALAQEPDPE